MNAEIKRIEIEKLNFITVQAIDEKHFEKQIDELKKQVDLASRIDSKIIW